MKPKANISMQGAITLELLREPNPKRWNKTIRTLKSFKDDVPQITLFSSRRLCDELRKLGLAAPSLVRRRVDEIELEWQHPGGYLLITICRNYRDDTIHPALD